MYLGTILWMIDSSIGILRNTDQIREINVPDTFESNLVKEGVVQWIRY